MRFEVEPSDDSAPLQRNTKEHQLRHYTTRSRFAIPDEEVLTNALQRVRDNSKPQLVAMIEGYVQQFFTDYSERDVLEIDALRLYQALFPERSSKFSNFDVEKTLKSEFGLKPSEKSKYFKVPVVSVIDETVDEQTGEVMHPAQMKVEWKGYCGKVYGFGRLC
jgi:hypothetical protein